MGLLYIDDIMNERIIHYNLKTFKLHVVSSRWSKGVVMKTCWYGKIIFNNFLGNESENSRNVVELYG